MLEFQAFCTRITDGLSLDCREDLAESASLYDDLLLDSLETFHLVVLTESLSGIAIPPESIPPLFTIGDVYAYYVQMVQASHGQAPPSHDLS